MDVRINTGNAFKYSAGDSVPSLRARGDVVVSVDPSKTNMAVIIASPNRVVYSILQFSAKGRENDNSLYCQDFKQFLREYLKDVRVYDAGIEAAISKRGMERHLSSMVLMEIRSQLIDLFLHDFKIRPKEVNNWSWKAAILPDGMRSKSEKGSIKFLPELYRLYGNSDVTDAMCILQYITLDYFEKYSAYCDKAEKPLYEHKISLIPKGNFPFKKVALNKSYNLLENTAFYTNRYAERLVMRVPVTSLRLDDIYACRPLFSKIPTESEVDAVIWRVQ